MAKDKQAVSADVDKLSDLAAQMDAEMGVLGNDLEKFEQDGGSPEDLLRLQMQLRELSEQTQTWSEIARDRADGLAGVVPKTG